MVVSIRVGDMVYVPESTRIWKDGKVKEIEEPSNYLVVSAFSALRPTAIQVFYEGENWAVSREHVYPPKEL